MPAPVDPPTEFDEDWYLHYNPDVATEVRAGRMPSGRYHWCHYGYRELRSGGLDPARAPVSPDALATRPYGINFYGCLSAHSGLGTAARGYARALAARDIPVLAIDVPPGEQTGSERQAPSGSNRFRINLIQQNADMIPAFVRVYADVLEAGYNIGNWFWELAALPGQWLPSYRYLDEVWVASEFCHRAVSALTALPVFRVSPVVAPIAPGAPCSRGYFGLPERTFLFYYSFDVNSHVERKNPFCFLKAFRQEFGGAAEAAVVLKLSHGESNTDQTDVLRRAIAATPNVYVYDAIHSDTETASLQQACDCFVSPHRAEGFGFNIAEAMYFGKPAIATRYSGNLDFMSDENSYLIDCDLVPIAATVGPYRRGLVWADPSVSHLRALMREVFRDEPGRMAKAALGARYIHEHFSVAAVGQAICARLDALGLRVPLSVRRRRTPQRSWPAIPFWAPDAPAAVIEEIRQLPRTPTISVLTPVFNAPSEWLRQCIESVRSQWYPHWELCLVDNGSTRLATVAVLESYRGIDPRIRIVRLPGNHGISAASNLAAEMSTGEYLAMLDHDDTISPDCLLDIARTIVADGDADLIYTDEDKIDERGAHVEHYLKPDFSLEHLRSVMYMLHLLVVRKQPFFRCGGFRSEFDGAQDYDLALRIVETAGRVVHIPKILYHWRKVAGSSAAASNAKPRALDRGRRALAEHLERSAIDATVEHGKLYGLFRARHRIRGTPLVSLLVITGDRCATIVGRGHISLPAHTARSIVETTRYRNFEVVIVSDGPLSERTKRELVDVPHRVVEYDPPPGGFNFARKVNFALRHTRSDFFVLLNDDIEVIGSDWLSAMLEFSQQPDIGVVGARLLLADGRLQHAGLAVGVGGGAAHLFYQTPASDVGYNGFTHLIRNYSAVTGACLASRLDVVESVGGFDERFATDYNDIDFCLRVLSSGRRVVFTPYAELYHFDHTSLPRTIQDPREVALFSRLWAHYLNRDPHYNPNLTRRDGSVALADGTRGC